MSFASDLTLRLRAAYPAIYVVAREDWRCSQEAKKVADEESIEFHSWSATRGLDGTRKTTDPAEAISKILEATRPGLWALINFHFFLDTPEMVQAVKDLVQECKAKAITVLFISNIWKLPVELSDDVACIEFPLPGRDLLGERYDYIAKEASLKDGSDTREAVIEAALGMTTWEAENAMSLSVVETEGRLVDSNIVSREKAKAVSKSGILEFYEAQVNMKDVGGLANLKAWLAQRKKAFSQEARAFGLPDPKGILLVGVPGCGKSLVAKAVSSEWNLPLLRFDLGRLFQGLVGASEENTRRAISVAEAVAPVVLWIDEIEKGMAGMSGSGATDSGVTLRVFGTLITWMQERRRPVFVVATANQVQNLPPELMRAGRWDEVFSVDLPSEEERKEILSIHLKKRARSPEDFNLEYIAREAAQFSGAEIEALVIKALFRAFYEGREVTTDDLMEAITVTVPLAVTRREEITALREWASTRAVPASKTVPPKLTDIEPERRRMRITSYVEEVGPDVGNEVRD